MLNKINDLVTKALNGKIFPGIEIFLAQGDSVLFHEAFGFLAKTQESKKLQKNSLFDLASLTKPLATAMAILHLYDSNKLDLKDFASNFLPELKRKETRDITISHLLTHTSGLPDWLPLFEPAFDKDTGWKRLINTKLNHKPGTKTVYSCLGYILLSEIVRRVSNTSLSNYCDKHIFSPLGLSQLLFNPSESTVDVDIVPTAYCPYRKKMLQGVVHDENAGLFEGEGGNAGLFGTIRDIYQLCAMLLSGGVLNNKRVLSRETAQLMLCNQNGSDLEPRTMGWDIKQGTPEYWSCGDLMPTGSIGHLGFTGTSIWMDPRSKIIVILLSNRVNINREENIPLMRAFRPEMHDLLFSSLIKKF
ncbi:beta-lactamase family protein [bacterium]|nr:beta-lactamase family protein [bacterium]